VQPIDLDNEFTYHPPRNDREVAEHQAIRDAGKALAQMIEDVVPASPQQTLAIRKCQEAVMWGNAGLACNRGQQD
jgi:hypothetical protein